MTSVEKKILGVGFIFVGLYFVRHVIQHKDKNDLVTTVRTLMGAICLILLGLVLIFFNIVLI
jgi:hypothetical protein